MVMDFSALRECHQPFHQVPRRSRVSSEPSSKLWFSRFFSFIPAGACLFCLGMLALLLTLPCTYRVGAVTFAFNGFQESDVYMVTGSPWTFQSNASCFYFDPPEASWNRSVPGRFLYPDRVQMKDPDTKNVKSFSTTFIFQIQSQQANTSNLTFGPGLSFVVVPDNVTVGAALDYMGLLTTDTSSSSKNYESDDHTLGVELDTFRNPEFNDPSDNHIGVNLASMLSTFIVDPVYPLASVRKDVYKQIWIDYFQAGSRLDIYIAPYEEGKPAMPQGSQTGVDLSLLLEDTYIGFSTAKGIESDNVPYVYAWSFSNDGIPAPPIFIGLDATSASPPADGSIAPRAEVPPLPSRVFISPPLPSGSSPPISMANPRSPSTRALGPAPTAKKRKRLNFRAIVGIVLSAFVLGICLAGLICWRIVFRRPLRIFISHGGASDGLGKNFTMWLNEGLKSLLKSRIKIFFDRDYIGLGRVFAREIIKELARFDVGIVVVTKEYFERKWSMIELIAFMEAEKNNLRNRIHIIPLFYGLTPSELKVHLDEGTWEDGWKEMTRGHPILVEKCRQAVKWLCTKRNILHDSKRQEFDKPYIDIVCKEIDNILHEERSFASNLCWAKTTMVETIIQKPLARKRVGIGKRTKRANQRIGKENGLMTYINKRLHFLFALSGLLNILFSIILDNSFNDQPIRFMAFAIFAPITIFWGFLASGWFPQIPLRFIAFIKRHGFLQQVVPCSPWHDNVVTNYCGKVCSLESLGQEEGTRLFELPLLVQNFLYGDQNSPQGTIATTSTHSTFESKVQDFEVATSMQKDQDLQGLTIKNEIFDFAPQILKCSHSKMVTNQESSSIFQKASSQVEDIVVNIDCFPMFHIFGNKQVSILEFDGPKINGFPMTIQAFKNTSTKDHNFDLSCTFRNKRTKRIYMTIERLQNLIQNMCQWMENPYPIVFDEANNILHCMAIEDILWEFTKMVYTFKLVYVEHRFLAGLGRIKFFATLSYVSISFVLSLIPLLSDKRSLFFLFFLFILAPYLITLDDANPLTFYFVKSLFCPICIKIFGFNRLYKSRSSFRWCNEFKKKKIVNPTYFWIDEEYANTFPDAASCLDICGFVELPDYPPMDHSFTIICQGWPRGIPAICKKQHDYKLQVKFDSIKLIKDVNCYTNVRLAFFEGDYLLSKRNYTFVEVQRVHLVEQLFHCFSDPSFGGYVEKICPRVYCSTTYVAHSPRFVDFCQTIFCSNPIPKLLVASRTPGSKFTVGVPLWSSELQFYYRRPLGV